MITAISLLFQSPGQEAHYQSKLQDFARIDEQGEPLQFLHIEY